MKNKLNKPHALKLFNLIKSYPGVVFLNENMILDEKISNWEVIDILVSFYHKHLPFDKVYKYAKFRNVICLNDLLLQYALLDRRIVYKILQSLNIPTPEYLVVNRQRTTLNNDLKKYLITNKIECDLDITDMKEEKDFIEVNNKRIYKPFVEKPADAENHNIYVYYADGTVRRLFRKRNNLSSEIDHTITGLRKNGNYIYEKFLKPDNSMDIKVYAIGEKIAYAEARKAPTVDGIVERCEVGFEKRNVVDLTEDECKYAQKITKGFKQFVCGFDILRANGRSYVIDVNGWSFVKNNDKYYSICSNSLFTEFNSYKKKLKIQDMKKIIRVYRHADRTPKQKLKIKIKENHHHEEKEIVIRENFDAIIELLKNYKNEKLCEILRVLKEIKGQKGIKLQIKCTKDSIEIILKWGGNLTHAGVNQSIEMAEDFRQEIMSQNPKLLENINVYSSTELRVNECAKIFISTLIPGDYEVFIDETLLDKTFQANHYIENGRKSTKAAFEQFKNHEDDQFIFNPIKKLNLSDNNGDLHPSMIYRWSVIKNKLVEITDLSHTVVSEILDNLKFDLTHYNTSIKKMFKEDLENLFASTRKYHSFILGTEYGEHSEDKIKASKAISGDLLKKIIDDLSSDDGINIYFTKESRMFTLFNLLNSFVHKLTKAQEFEYCSMIELSKYIENEETRICIKFNEGISTSSLLSGPLDSKHCIRFHSDKMFCDLNFDDFVKLYNDL